MRHAVDWAVNLPLLALAASVLWWRVGRSSPWRMWFWPTLALRLAGGIGVGLLFSGQLGLEHPPGNDTGAFHMQGAALTAWGRHDLVGYARLLWTAQPQPGAPPVFYTAFSNSFFFARLLSLLNWVTGASYWINGLWLSLASFAGCWLLMRELARLAPGAAPGIVVGALLWPSVVFWGAGVLKDALLLACLGAFTAAALRLIYPTEARVGRWWLLLGISGWFFWKIKFFIAAVAFVVWGALAITRAVHRRWPRLKPWQLFLGLAVVLAPLSRLLHRAFRPEYLLYHLPHNQEVLRAKSVGQPQLLLPLEPSLSSFAVNSPAAVAGVFTRPWLWEGRGMFWHAVGLENTLLLVLAGWALVGWWRRGRPRHLHLVAAALLAFVVVVAVMLGLSTPNLGSLHRYRMVLLPYTLTLLAWLRWGKASN